MKKNKKYWKQQAESWREIAEMETESANHWAGEYYLLHDEFEELELKFDILKRELNTLRQYNIGKKRPESSKINSPHDLWDNKFVPEEDDYLPAENNVINMWKNNWSKNIPESPNKTGCNCNGCNCKK